IWLRFRQSLGNFVVSRLGIGGDKLIHYGMFQQMNLTQLAAQRHQLPEGIGIRRVGHARKVDLEKLFVLFAVAGRMQHRIDIIQQVDGRKGAAVMAGGVPLASGTTRRSPFSFSGTKRSPSPSAICCTISASKLGVRLGWPSKVCCPSSSGYR